VAGADCGAATVVAGGGWEDMVLGVTGAADGGGAAGGRASFVGVVAGLGVVYPDVVTRFGVPSSL